MKKYARAFLLVALVLPLIAVFSAATTLLLFPFWAWLESFSGIESVGHSGPAVWCHCFVLLLLLVALSGVVFLRAHIRRGRQDGVVE